MRAAVKADVAITNGGGIRADRQYEAGRTLTRRDILSELPFGNTTVLIEVTGAGLKAALEHGLSEVRQLGGRFPHVSGLTVVADVGRPVGERVIEVAVGGRPLDPDRVYRVATNDFMAKGGDGYRVLVGARHLIDPAASQLMATQVIDYVAGAPGGRIAPAIEGRVVLR